MDKITAIILLFTNVVLAAPLSQKISGTDLVTGSLVRAEKTEQPTAVVFLSSHCPCSRSHEQHLKVLSKNNPQVRFIGVHSDDEPLHEAKSYFAQASLGFPVIQDKNAHWANEFKALATPHVFLYDSSGSLKFRGGVSDTSNALEENGRNIRFFLKEAMEAINQGKEVSVKEARVLGCPIRR